MTRLGIRGILLCSAVAAVCPSPSLAFNDFPGMTASSVAPPTAEQDAPIATHPRQQRLNPTGRDIQIDVPLRERGPLGQVEIRISPSDEVFVSNRDLQAALSRLVTPDALSAISAAADADGWLTVPALGALGFDVVYDAALIELALNIPVSARNSQSVNLGFGSGIDAPIQPDTSALFAAYASYRIGWDYVHRGNEEGLRSPRVDLDINGRIGRRVSFENQLSYDDTQAEAFSRQSSRLIFDQPEKQLRWIAGDLNSQPVSFQGQEDIAGFGVQRLYRGFGSGRTVSSSSARSVTLQRNATVDVLVNGVRVRSLQLAPGNYDLRDLPLTAGANDVQLVIEDELGGREVLNFDFFSDFLLLQPGVDEFDFQVGVRAPFNLGERDYQSDRPIASGFYRRGVTERLTLGGNFQVADDVQQIGAEGVFATTLGLFKTDVSVSNADGAGSGYAARLEYRYTLFTPNMRGARRFDAAIETRSENFASVDTIDPQNEYDFTALVRYSQPLAERWTGSLGADYSSGRGDQEDRYGASAFASYDVSSNTNINFGVIYQNGQAQFDDRDEVNFRVDLIHRFGLRSSANASYESADQRVRLGYQRGPDRQLDDFGVSAQIESNRDTVAVDATVIYLNNRAEFEVAHQTAFDQAGDEIVGQTTSLRTSGTIAFADGQFALGRRITDSFAILKSHPTLEGRPVLVRSRFNRDPVARSGLFGPALVPLSSYNPQNIPYDVEDLPLGYDLGAGTFEFYPWLNSGFSRIVGSSYNVTVIGTLLDPDGNPLPLSYGVAESLDDPAAPKVELFTNRAGRYGASGLSEGRWVFRMTNGLVYSLVIDAANGNLVRNETLRPVRPEEVAR